MLRKIKRGTLVPVFAFGESAVFINMQQNDQLPVICIAGFEGFSSDSSKPEMQGVIIL